MGCCFGKHEKESNADVVQAEQPTVNAPAPQKQSKAEAAVQAEQPAAPHIDASVPAKQPSADNIPETSAPPGNTVSPQVQQKPTTIQTPSQVADDSTTARRPTPASIESSSPSHSHSHSHSQAKAVVPAEQSGAIIPERSAPAKTVLPQVQQKSITNQTLSHVADDSTTDRGPTPAETASIDSPLPSHFQPQAETLEDCICALKHLHSEGLEIDNFIDAIENLLDTLDNSTADKPLKRSIDSETEKRNASSVSTSLLQGGTSLLEFLNKHIQVEKGDEGSRQAVADILEKVGKVHWVVGGLAIVAFLLDQISQVSENQAECIDLLRQMLKLSGHIRHLKLNMPQEEKEFSEAMLLIVDGSMMCASQLKSKKLFRFLKASVDSRSLNGLQAKINQLYQHLNMRVVREIQHEQPTLLPRSQPLYPYYAVGIEDQKNHVTSLLDLKTANSSPFAVVIYGFGGIGKTTLANAVIACLDLKHFNYTGVQMHEGPVKNDLQCIQQQILKDAFPAYNNGKPITLRNLAEGQDHLSKAFKTVGNNPAFIFIDNAVRGEDLQQLLPKSLKNLPKRSRIVVTTRNLGVTDMLKQRGFERREHLVDTLPNEEAKKILFKEARNVDLDDYEDELNKMLRICNGIPLVLEIVRARLEKQQYRVDRCSRILEDLERGVEIKEESLSKRLITYVYNELEQSTQEAFLDICCFFTQWNREHVEHIVGADNVTFLEEAALVKTSDKNKLIVHDVIRANGQSMSKFNRITAVQSLREATEDQLKQMKGVWLADDESGLEIEIEVRHLILMRCSLRVLCLGKRIKVINLESHNTYKFEGLRYLQIKDEIPCLPMKLMIFDRLAVFHGPIFWEGVNLYQLPITLRMMIATAQPERSESRNLQTSKSREIQSNSFLEQMDSTEVKSVQKLPDGLHHLTALKTLILDEWDKLEELPDEVCQLSSLRKFSIRDGHSLRNLPDMFGRLSSLEELNLTDCKALSVLPHSFGELKSLKDLDLGECSELTELPSNFGELSSLEVLNLESCWKLEGLPPSFGKLSKLKKLSLQSENLKELAANFGELSSLAEFRCNYCGELKQLPESFGQLRCLTILDLTGCTKLKSLPPTLVQLRSLKDLSLLACHRLEALPWKIVEFQSLELLDLRHCRSLKRRPSFPPGRDFTIRLPEHLTDQDPILSTSQPPWK